MPMFEALIALGYVVAAPTIGRWFGRFMQELDDAALWATITEEVEAEDAEARLRRQALVDAPPVTLIVAPVLVVPAAEAEPPPLPPPPAFIGEVFESGYGTYDHYVNTRFCDVAWYRRVAEITGVPIRVTYPAYISGGRVSRGAVGIEIVGRTPEKMRVFSDVLIDRNREAYGFHDDDDAELVEIKEAFNTLATLR